MSENNLKKEKKGIRILSIDGGGVKGIFSIYAIMKLKEEYNIDVYDEFDVFVGTSTGALIAAWILFRKDYRELYEFYIDKENKIFSEKYEFMSKLKINFLPQYKEQHFKNTLDLTFGNMTFSEFEKIANKKFIFTSTNITKGRPIIYASSDFSSYSSKKINNVKIKDALYSSSAAPFYFPPEVDLETKNVLVDGGLWANTPSTVGMALVFGDLNYRKEEIKMLSLGQTKIDDINFEIHSGKDMFKNIRNNQIWALFSSSIIARQNFDNLLSKTLLGEWFFRYSPKKTTPSINLDKISDEFVKYSKQYWEENKKDLVEFIKKDFKQEDN